MWVRDHSRSLKLVPFESLGAVSYSPSIVTVTVSTVCKTFSVKEWRDLENQDRGRSRSLKLVPFKSLGTVFYCFCPSSVKLTAWRVKSQGGVVAIPDVITSHFF